MKNRKLLELINKKILNYAIICSINLIITRSIYKCKGKIKNKKRQEKEI